MSGGSDKKLQQLEARSIALQQNLLSTLDVLNQRRSSLTHKVQSARQVGTYIGFGVAALVASRVLLSSAQRLISFRERTPQLVQQQRRRLSLVDVAVPLVAAAIGAFLARRAFLVRSPPLPRHSPAKALREKSEFESVTN